MSTIEIKIQIPTPLRVYTNNNKVVIIKAGTINDALKTLGSMYPGLKTHIFDDTGNLRNFVNLYLNDEDIRYLSNKGQTLLKEGDILSIIPSIAGGSTSD